MKGYYMSSYYYFDQFDQQKKGPFNAQQIKDLARSGHIKPNTPMFAEGKQFTADKLQGLSFGINPKVQDFQPLKQDNIPKQTLEKTNKPVQLDTCSEDVKNNDPNFMENQYKKASKYAGILACIVGASIGLSLLYFLCVSLSFSGRNTLEVLFIVVISGVFCFYILHLAHFIMQYFIASVYVITVYLKKNSQ